MSKLTTQLQQARQEIAEKEAESRAWEEEVTGLSQQLREASSKLKVNRNTMHVNCPVLDCAPPSPTFLFPSSLLFFPSPLPFAFPPLPPLFPLTPPTPSLPSFLTQERSSKLHQTATTLQAVQSECATYKNMAEGYQEEYERATAKLNVRSSLFLSHSPSTPSSSFLCLLKQ